MNSCSTRNQVFDIAIVGGGIVALSTAWEFARRDPKARIALVSPFVNTGSASRASGAMLSAYGETTRFSFASEAGQTKLAWRFDAARIWKSWIAELAEASDDNSIQLKSGTIIFINSVSGCLDQRNFQSIIELLSSRKEVFSKIDPVADAGMCPSTAERPMQAIYLPQECYVDSTKVLNALHSLIKASSAITWFDSICTEVRPLNDVSHHYALTIKRQEILTRKVIIAAGAQSLHLIEKQEDIVAKNPPVLNGVRAAIVCKQQGS